MAKNDHSPKFELVKSCCGCGSWDESYVRKAVGKWITAGKAEEILGS